MTLLHHFLQAEYVILHNGTQGISSAGIRLVIANITETSQLTQAFATTFFRVRLCVVY